MAGENRDSTHDVAKRLSEDPAHFDFFHAVRSLECARPGTPGTGRTVRAADDVVRFGQEPTLRFAPSSLHAYEPGGEGRKPRLSVNFMGLLGPNGPLPLHVTEYVHDRLRNHKDATLARFLDIFNDRMVALLYRAWAVNQQTVSHDAPREDRFAVYIASLFGIGMDSLRDRDEVPDAAKLCYSGRLVCQTRNAEGLRAVLADYFGLPTEIESFVGQWITLPEEYRSRIGESPETGTLGASLVVGSRVWECQQKFRIRLGPMGLDDFERMLPSGESFTRLRAWVRNYVGDELGWEMQLVLKAREVPAVCLGQAGRLGWSTWVRSRPFERDAGDLVIQAGAA